MLRRFAAVLAALAGWLLGSLSSGLAAAPAGEAEVVPLAGTWRFRLDPGNEGVAREWFKSELPERIRLPGSTDEAGFGAADTREPDLGHLSRVVEYTGPAWYQRDLEVPAGWAGKRVTLFLERCHWETRVWVEDRPAGLEDSLSAPHVFDLGTALAPGAHRLAIRVDNSVKHFLGAFASSISEETQTNWNGIIGRIELRATDPVWIEALEVHPDLTRGSARVRLTVGNGTGGAVEGRLTLEAGTEGIAAARAERDFLAGTGSTELEIDLPLGVRPRLWDEFDPRIHSLTASLSAKGREGSYADRRGARFGMRSIGIAEKRITLNGRPVLLRGTLECCIFPRTGYPPMEEEAWAKIFATCHSYGLNHMRFHSWCPPEAAFEAADRAGFLLQVEAPRANVGADPARDRFIDAEVDRILAAYGNHPSFAMLCMGNELEDSTCARNRELVSRSRRKDARHLYTASTAWGHVPEDEYLIITDGRGIHGPGTDSDLRKEAAAHPVPVVYHEIGQWTVFPDLAGIAKYTGVLRARNFERVRKDLERAGLAEQAPAFTAASGRLSALLYKEEIEVLLRTPGISGFQLLALHDYPGTGTAVVGMLDAFWDSKGLITPEAFRRFAGPTVPLLRIAKRTFTAAETFHAQAEVCHFGPRPIVDASAAWRIEDGSGEPVASGKFPPRTIDPGGSTGLGEIAASLAAVRAPARLTMTVGIEGTPFSNDWRIWVYPDAPPPPAPADVLVRRAWDGLAIEALKEGRKVLLFLTASVLAADRAVPGRFTTPFWSPVWFKEQAGPMGILPAPDHPALASFPTEGHSDWQWYHLLAGSCSVVLDGTPAGYRPIVQAIDDYSRNRKLGVLFEARVGEGRLVVSGIDLPALDGRPEGRELLRSLFRHMASDSFRPAVAFDLPLLDRLLAPPAPPPPGGGK